MFLLLLMGSAILQPQFFTFLLFFCLLYSQDSGKDSPKKNPKRHPIHKKKNCSGGSLDARRQSDDSKDQCDVTNERKVSDTLLCKKEEAYVGSVTDHMVGCNKSGVKSEEDVESGDEVICEVHPDDAINEIWEKAGEIGK